MVVFQVCQLHVKRWLSSNSARGDYEKLAQILPQISDACDPEYGRSLFHDVVEGLNQRSKSKTAVIGKNAHWNTVVALIKAGYRPDSSDKKGNSPLHLFFSVVGDVEARLPFLQRYLQLPTLLLNKQNDQGHTVLHLAPYTNLAILDWLLTNTKPDLTLTDWHGATPFHHAITSGLDAVTLFVTKKCCPIDQTRTDNSTGLHLAAAIDNHQIVDYLLDHGANPNHRDVLGRAPIHVAGYIGNEAIVKSLIGHHADLRARDSQGNNIVHFISMGKLRDEARAALLEYLINVGGEAAIAPMIHEQNHMGATPLHCASVNAHVGLIEIFIDRFKSSVSLQMKSGPTPLHLYISGINCSDSKQTLLFEKMFLRFKVPVMGEPFPSLLQIAALCGKHDLISQLWFDGQDLPAEKKITSLHFAVGSKNKEASGKTVIELIRMGADSSSPDEYGLTCGHWAAFINPDIFEIPGLDLGVNPQTAKIEIFNYFSSLTKSDEDEDLKGYTIEDEDDTVTHDVDFNEANFEWNQNPIQWNINLLDDEQSDQTDSPQFSMDSLESPVSFEEESDQFDEAQFDIGELQDVQDVNFDFQDIDEDKDFDTEVSFDLHTETSETFEDQPSTSTGGFSKFEPIQENPTSVNFDDNEIPEKTPENSDPVSVVPPVSPHLPQVTLEDSDFIKKKEKQGHVSASLITSEVNHQFELPNENIPKIMEKDIKVSEEEQKRRQISISAVADLGKSQNRLERQLQELESQQAELSRQSALLKARDSPNQNHTKQNHVTEPVPYQLFNTPLISLSLVIILILVSFFYQ